MNTEQALAIINSNAPAASEDQELAVWLNQMILNDFEGLIQLLYRIDVQENEVRQLLRGQPGTDAGILLAGLLRQRQLEKQRTRQQYRQQHTHIPDEDRW